MIARGVHRGKIAVAGIAAPATAMTGPGADQAAVRPVTLRAGVMDHRVVGINRIANRRMATGAVKGHGHKLGMVGLGVLAAKTAMAIATGVGSEIASGLTDQLTVAIMTR